MTDIKKVFSGFIVASTCLYILVLYFMLFVGFGRGNVAASASMLDNFNYWNSVNLVPFKTIAEYATTVADGNIRGHAIRNLYGNLLLFFPVGFYLPFFMRKINKFRVYSIITAAIIIAVEVVQLVTRTGSLDIDDFILNFAGASLGFIVFTRTQIRCIFKLRAW